ncbi:hypothetical protein [Euzebya sp.]|uniref:hypothetical protein n=1 Tax=Euzebya sp. TaxID=1971409 RepID=UPI0035188841
MEGAVAQTGSTGRPADEVAAAEALARRALGLDAVWCTAVGVGAVVGGGSIGRAVDLPAGVVRLAGAATLGWAAAVGVWSVAEGWEAGTRRVAAANGAAVVALLGHAAVRGTRSGRVGIALVAGQAAGFAAAQVRALVVAGGAGPGGVISR